MTYQSRGRSNKEVVLAVALVGFVIGCMLTLCIGNYLRAKKAMERQRQRRLAGATQGRGNGLVMDSPRSHPSSSTTGSSAAGGGERQPLVQRTSARRHQQQLQQPNIVDENDDDQDLIEFQPTTDARRPPVMLMSV